MPLGNESACSASGNRDKHPCNFRLAIITGMTRETIHGNIRYRIRLPAVTLPLIQSMMVVTSPMGDHAPPLLAAMMMTPANNQRSCSAGMSLRSIITIMMVVVILSNTADMKKVMRARVHNSAILLRVVMWSVITLNPPCVSIRSTIVIAPMRKTSVSQVLPKCSMSLTPVSVSPDVKPYIDQIKANMNKAVADLSIFILCSRTIHKYPKAKRIVIVSIISFYYYIDKHLSQDICNTLMSFVYSLPWPAITILAKAQFIVYCKDRGYIYRISIAELMAFTHPLIPYNSSFSRKTKGKAK